MELHYDHLFVRPCTPRLENVVKKYQYVLYLYMVYLKLYGGTFAIPV